MTVGAAFFYELFNSFQLQAATAPFPFKYTELLWQLFPGMNRFMICDAGNKKKSDNRKNRE